MFGKTIATMMLAAAALTATTAHAQAPASEMPRTLLGSPTSHGVFGATSVRATKLAGETTALTGGELVWLVNHRAFLGLEGWSSAADNVKVTAPGATKSEHLDISYGGLSAGYIFRPHSVLHATTRLFAGAGVLSLGETLRGDSLDDDIIYVVEPNLGVELNVARFVRLGVGASYRMAGDVELAGLRNKDINGFSGELTLRFGKF